ncbi:trypsin 3A1-like [Cimex lectularius]|uniref:Peptidase S1 domain-containing protein n=1 Tax=Cimex lectularius TaxID=79782 RepID=A0A8I6RJD8_CIMLE|nr:trypsin 3A1-like [Cimex lectularius]
MSITYIFSYLLLYNVIAFSRSKYHSFGKIVGGRFAKKYEFPFVVSIQLPEENHICGGIVFSLIIVVSSCHCAGTFIGKTFTYFDSRIIVIVAGSVDRTPSEDNQTRKVRQVIRHPRCSDSGQGWEYDYSLFILNRALATTPGYIRTIPLYSSDIAKIGDFLLSVEKHGTPCQAVGWGYQNVSGNGIYVNKSTLLKAIKVRLIAKRECKAILCTDPSKYCILDKRNLLCGIGHGGDTCSGDSGGPLICQGYLAGITSWGPECGEYGKTPTIYASVDGLMQFPFLTSGTIVRSFRFGNFLITHAFIVYILILYNKYNY